MEDENILTDIEAIIIDISHIEPGFDYTLDLYSEIGVESINSMAILVELEEKFDVQIDDSKFIQSRTLQKLAELVNDSI